MLALLLALALVLALTPSLRRLWLQRHPPRRYRLQQRRDLQYCCYYQLPRAMQMPYTLPSARAPAADTLALPPPPLLVLRRTLTTLQRYEHWRYSGCCIARRTRPRTCPTRDRGAMKPFASGPPAQQPDLPHAPCGRIRRIDAPIAAARRAAEGRGRVRQLEIPSEWHRQQQWLQMKQQPLRQQQQQPEQQVARRY